MAEIPPMLIGAPAFTFGLDVARETASERNHQRAHSAVGGLQPVERGFLLIGPGALPRFVEQRSGIHVAEVVLQPSGIAVGHHLHDSLPRGYQTRKTSLGDGGGAALRLQKHEYRIGQLHEHEP